jgi:LysM repeat protein
MLKKVLGWFVTLLCLALAVSIPVQKTSAAAGDADGIMNAVNALRASRGLPPYTYNSSLVSFAQEHSNYMAQIHQGTHLRSDGSTPFSRGIGENVADGMTGYLTPEYAVYTIWSDAIHMQTMVGYASGSMGVGVAEDSTTTYYTLDVIPSGKTVSLTTGGGGATQSLATLPPIPLVTLVTTTPMADGRWIHMVGYGQSLYTIATAYGVHVDDIRRLNGIPTDSNVIVSGEKLLVRMLTPTPTVPTATGTPLPDTPTPTETPTLVPTPTETLAPTPTPTPTPFELPGGNVTFGSGVFVVAGLCFAVWILSKAKRN